MDDKGVHAEVESAKRWIAWASASSDKAVEYLAVAQLRLARAQRRLESIQKKRSV